MEEKLTQAEGNPVSAADQAPNKSNENPAATTEQGSSSAPVETPTTAEQTKTPEASTEPSAKNDADASASEKSVSESAAPESTPPAGDQSKEVDMPPVITDPTADAVVNLTDTQASSSTNDQSITMEDVLAASDEQLGRPPVHRGMIVTGSVIMLSQDGIVIDVGAKIEGLLPYNQLFEFDTNAKDAAKYFKPGDELQVYIVRSDVPNNVIILSKKRADQERAWNLLQEIYEKKLPVEVEIVEEVRGGLVANLGVRAFLPASQVDIRRINDLKPYVERRLKVKIIELNRKRNRVIVSRRAILEDEIKEQKGETLKKLEPGLVLDGEVVEITDFGVFVNLGGVDGLVHRSELSHGRFNHPKEVIKVGDKVKVEVLDMDLERERINLSMKKLISNPWENVLLNYTIGQKVSGTVTNLTPFGAFVEIETGLEGLIHVSEMSWTKRVRHPKEIIQEGDEIDVMILKIDNDQQRISLGLRQTQPDPWSSLPDRFPPGTEVTGPITGITEFGVFMEIEEGIEGLVHISELAHEHIESIEEHFSKGDEVNAVILNIDPVEQRASLSRKRLLPYTGPDKDADFQSMPFDAPASSNRGSGRKGRRGGRRNQGIDYDYSYASSESSSKATTKLGDVYADLFAQFGLTETSAEPEPKSGEEKPSQEAKAEAPKPEKKPAPKPEKKPAPKEEAVDPENAIDAAEAAALLTAAFKEGKRPVKLDDSASSETESAEASAEASTNAADANEAATEDVKAEADVEAKAATEENDTLEKTEV